MNSRTLYDIISSNAILSIVERRAHRPSFFMARTAGRLARRESGMQQT